MLKNLLTKTIMILAWLPWVVCWIVFVWLSRVNVYFSNRLLGLKTPPRWCYWGVTAFFDTQEAQKLRDKHHNNIDM